MTAGGSQGHPGWDQNRPSSLKFLSACGVCLHPDQYSTLQTILPKDTHNLSNVSTVSGSTDITFLDIEDVYDAIPQVSGDAPDVVMEEDLNPFVEEDEHMDTDTPTVASGTTLVRRLHPSVLLPATVTETILNTACTNYPSKVNTEIVSMFGSTKQCKLTKLDLRGTAVTDESIDYLIKHPLTHMDLRECPSLTSNTFTKVINFCPDLLHLAIDKHVIDNDEASKRQTSSPQFHNLRSLTIESVKNLFEISDVFVNFFSKPCFRNLQSLDLSDCQGKYEDASPLTSLKLVNLSLYNCKVSSKFLCKIAKITTLRSLDVSCKSNVHNYSNPHKILKHLAESLTNLTYLDISGTNLCGDEITPTEVYDAATKSYIKCDISALACRALRPLEVLGLLSTEVQACHWNHLPATLVLGESGEKQVLNTIKVMMHRHSQLTSALNELFHLFRFENVADFRQALELVFRAMTLHHYNQMVQISGSASLFYITRSDEIREQVPVAARQHMVTILINAMERFPQDYVLLRNGSLTISQLKIPQHLIFEYERLVKLFLKVIREEEPAPNAPDQQNFDFVRRMSLHLLNGLACQVEGYHKIYVGKLGAIDTMLKLIQSKLDARRHDDMLELAWSVMWNITDETPWNCLIFLDGGGMGYFSDCLKEFSEHEDLLRNMMGLLGNVAEVPHLRPRIMTSELMDTFVKLLKSSSGGIEVSYNAAGVLSHIASDGHWDLERPSRTSVLAALDSVVASWDLKTIRNINYRSFEPIMRLLGANTDHTPACQHWATWALANLTRVYPDRYCRLVQSEGGIRILDRLSSAPRPAHIVRLSKLVLQHCRHYELYQSLDKLYDDAVCAPVPPLGEM